MLSVAGFACGSDRATPAKEQGATTAGRTNVVSNADIRRTRPDTPERTLLTWAQAVQFSDVSSARRAYSRRIRATVSRSRLDAAVREIGELLGEPRIVRPLIRGKIALMRAELLSYGPSGQRSVQRTTFRLRREGSHWRLDDVHLLLDTAAALRRARS